MSKTAITPFGIGLPIPVAPAHRHPAHPLSMLFDPLGMAGTDLIETMGGFKVDVLDEEGEYKVKADFPGIDKADIQVKLEDDVLTISYENKQETGERDDDGKWLAHERVYSSMKRSFTLPNADEDKTTASVADGVLTVVVPKREPAQTEKTIEIS